MAIKTYIDGGKQAITYYNDTQPVAVYVDGDLQENVSFVHDRVQGTGSVEYTSEYKKNHIEYEIQGTTVQSLLPSEYQQVEYIESTGTQIIDTGFLPTNNTKVELDLKFSNGVATSSRNACLGVLDNENVFSVNFGGGEAQLTELYIWVNNTSSGGETYANVDVGADTISNRNLFILTNSEFIYGTNNVTLEKGTWETLSQSLRLFGRVNNAVNEPFNRYHIILYGGKIYDNDILVRNFIPCYRKSNSVIGLYDLVNNVFYSNSGTGTFLKGADYNQTPTPEAPIPIQNANQKSTNLFDESTVLVGKQISDTGVEDNNTYQRLSDYIEIEPNTTYRLSDVYHTFHVHNANSAQNVFDRCACYDESKTLISVLFAISRTQKGQHTTTFTTPENAKYIRITQGKFAEKTMLTKGEAFVSYLPFGNYGSKVVLHGKNLIDDVYNVFFATNTYANNLKRVEKDGRNCIYYTYNTGRQYVIEGGFKENTQYTISFDSLTGKDKYGSTVHTPLIGFWYTDGTSSAIGSSSKEWKHSKITSTAGKTVKSIGTSTYTNVEIWIDRDTFMFQEGAVETPYEPYFREEIYIPTSIDVDGTNVPLLFSKYDKLTVDRVSNKVVYGQKSAQYQFTGSETFALAGSGFPYNFRTEQLTIPCLTGNGKPLLSTHFKNTNSTSLIDSANGEGYFIQWNTSVWYFNYDSQRGGVNNFKNWLKTNYGNGSPITVQYQTATPIEHDITNTDLGQKLLNLDTQNQTNYFEITSKANAPQTPINFTYAKWGGRDENNNNT